MRAKLYRAPVETEPDESLADLSLWVAEHQVDEAAAARARQRSLEQQAAQESSLAGVLVDLAERDVTVTIRTAGGSTCGGRIIAVGADFVLLRDPTDGDCLVPVVAIATISGTVTDRPVTGTRASSAVALAEALDELAADEARVVVTVGAECVAGVLWATGSDIVAVADSDARQDAVYVALSAIDHLTVLAR